MAGHWVSWSAVGMIFPTWFDHLSSYKEVQFKMFCPLVKSSCPSAKNGYETSVIVLFAFIYTGSLYGLRSLL